MSRSIRLGHCAALAVSVLLAAAMSSGCATNQCQLGQSICNADGTITTCGDTGCSGDFGNCANTWSAPSTCDALSQTTGLTCQQWAPDQAVCVPPETTLTCSSTPLPIDPFVTSAATGDFNGDGYVDVVQLGTNGTPCNLETALGDGTGHFRAGPAQMASPGDWESLGTVVSGDFNGDGHLDVAADQSSPAGVLVWLGDGTGGFASPVFEAAEVSVFAVGDINHDGRTDIVVGTAVLIAGGNGSFTAEPLSLPAPCATPDGSAVLADLDGDGWVDLALPAGPQVCVLFNDGSGHLSIPVVASTGVPSSTPQEIAEGITTGASAIGAADLDGDGLIDLALLEQTTSEIMSNTVTVVAIPGQLKRTFGTPMQSSLLPFTVPVGMAVADVNGDGLADIVTGGGETLAIMLGQKEALNVTPTFSAPTGAPLLLAALADFTGDHRADALVLQSPTNPAESPLVDVANACTAAAGQ